MSDHEKQSPDKDAESTTSGSKELDGGRITAEGVDKAYEAKVHLINKCLQEEIGWGRYQWQLHILAGLGWLADNLWFQGVAIVLPQVKQELSPKRVEYSTLALYAGLIVGATTWGVLADVIGRRLSFQVTLFLAGVFGIAAGGANNFVTFAALLSCIGFGVGGNLPVDGAMYLENIPQSSQWTLTLLSAWWALGQLVASVIAWGFIGNYSCASSIPEGQCPKSENMGWRYVFYVLGVLTFIVFICRFAIFNLQESSKYLVAKGRDEEAIRSLEHIARVNGKTITLTLDQLRSVPGHKDSVPPLTLSRVVRKAFTGLSLSHIKPLFSTRRLAVNTTLTISLWMLIGLAYPLFNAFLPFYLATRVANANDSIAYTYRNYSIISVLGVPGSIIACLIVDYTRGQGKFAIGGRKFGMSFFTLLTAIFLYLFTTSKTQGAYLAYSCVSSLVQNAMYGILYAYTPEVFPAPHRGTADALCSALNRVCGLLAVVIKITTTTAAGASTANANVPVFISATLFIVAAIIMLFLPIETAGRAAL